MDFAFLFTVLSTVISLVATSSVSYASGPIASHPISRSTCLAKGVTAEIHLPVEPSVARPSDLQSLTRDDVEFMDIFEPEKFKELIKTHPEYQIWIEDQKFKELGRVFAEQKKYEAANDIYNVNRKRDEIDTVIRRLYPGKQYLRGYDDLAAYINRQRWRAETGGRPIPGDPGGPHWSHVDQALGGPHIAPIDGSGKISHFATGSSAYVVVTEPKLHEANAYDGSGKRIGALPYSMSDQGQTLVIGHMEVEPENQNRPDQRVGSALFAELLQAHPGVQRITTQLMDMNSHAFWIEYDRTHDYYTAIKATPAYKQRARAGFGKILPPKHDWDTSPFVEYEAVRGSGL